MKFLLDECLPPRLAPLLRDSGHDCVHVYDIDLGGRPDDEVMATAARKGRILVFADTDFRTTAFRQRRRDLPRVPDQHAYRLKPSTSTGRLC